MERLSAESLERILIALAQAKTESGLAVNVPFREALRPLLFDMLPPEIQQPWRMCGDAPFSEIHPYCESE